VLTNFTEIQPPFYNNLNRFISVIIFGLNMIAFFFLVRQACQYKALFIFIAPKITIMYMLIGDILLLIH
jgi:hypothetical protein